MCNSIAFWIIKGYGGFKVLNKLSIVQSVKSKSHLSWQFPYKINIHTHLRKQQWKLNLQIGGKITIFLFEDIKTLK